MEQYRTLRQAAQAEIEQKHSRFIGCAAPVATPEEADSFLQQVKRTYKEASHYVFAYRLRMEQRKRYSDDGEPQGTAGLPVLDVLERGDVLDAAIVVVRYFGGVLLGTGGLTRAYGHAAKLAVDAAGILLLCECVRLRVVCDYSFYGRLESLLAGQGAVVEDTRFAGDVTVEFRLPQQEKEPFDRILTEAGNGRFAAQELGRVFADTGTA